MGFSFREDDHSYWLDGRRLPGVTSILDDWHKIDCGSVSFYYNPRTETRVPADKWEAAQDRGTAVHEMLFLCLNGQGVNRSVLHPDLLPYLEQIERFIDRYKPRVLLAEHKGYHPQLLYAGRLDFVIETPLCKRLILADAKSGMRGQVGPQTSAYEPLARQGLKFKGIMERYCLDLKPDNYDFQPCGQATDFQYFRYRLWAYNYERRAA